MSAVSTSPLNRDLVSRSAKQWVLFSQPSYTVDTLPATCVGRVRSPAIHRSYRGRLGPRSYFMSTVCLRPPRFASYRRNLGIILLKVSTEAASSPLSQRHCRESCQGDAVSVIIQGRVHSNNQRNPKPLNDRESTPCAK